MNKSLTNIIVLVGIAVTAIAGYLLFSQNSEVIVSSGPSDQQLQQILQSSQLFVMRSRELAQIDMDTELFEDPVFTALKSYSPPPEEFPVGRANPFAPATQ